MSSPQPCEFSLNLLSCFHQHAESGSRLKKLARQRSEAEVYYEAPAQIEE